MARKPKSADSADEALTVYALAESLEPKVRLQILTTTRSITDADHADLFVPLGPRLALSLHHDGARQGGRASYGVRGPDGSFHALVLSGRVRDRDLAGLAHLTTLRHLNLSHTEVTDAGLVHLRGLRSLQTLLLTHTRVTDGGLAHLAGLRSLRILGLRETPIAGPGLGQLAACRRLRALDLAGTAPHGRRHVIALRAALPRCAITWRTLTWQDLK